MRKPRALPALERLHHLGLHLNQAQEGAEAIVEGLDVLHLADADIVAEHGLRILGSGMRTVEGHLNARRGTPSVGQ
jgi:hypothetical protein